jgi:heat shock protein HslJ
LAFPTRWLSSGNKAKESIVLYKKQEEKRMKIANLLLIMLVLITSACSSIQSSGGTLPIPSEWKLVSIGNAGAEAPVVEGSSIILKFDVDGQASGTGGCNSYGAKYEAQGHNLVFKEFISTMMACVDEQVNQQESQYFAALQAATKFEILGDNLIIYYDDGQSQLNFTKQ